MKKLLFFGDSITDMSRDRNTSDIMQYGFGYVFLTAAKLIKEYPNEYQIINKGIGGNTIYDLTQRYKEDVISYQPDVVTILFGVNDVRHRIDNNDINANKLYKFIKLYEEMIIDLKAKLPNTQFIIMEPYVVRGLATEPEERYLKFCEVFKYAKKIKSLAKKYDIPFVKLQKKLEQGQELYGSNCLHDGVHPDIVGASIISNEWIKTFKKIYK